MENTTTDKLKSIINEIEQNYQFMNYDNQIYNSNDWNKLLKSITTLKNTTIRLKNKRLKHTRKCVPNKRQNCGHLNGEKRNNDHVYTNEHLKDKSHRINTSYDGELKIIKKDEKSIDQLHYEHYNKKFTFSSLESNKLKNKYKPNNITTLGNLSSTTTSNSIKKVNNNIGWTDKLSNLFVKLKNKVLMNTTTTRKSIRNKSTQKNSLKEAESSDLDTTTDNITAACTSKPTTITTLNSALRKKRAYRKKTPEEKAIIAKKQRTKLNQAELVEQAKPTSNQDNQRLALRIKKSANNNTPNQSSEQQHTPLIRQRRHSESNIQNISLENLLLLDSEKKRSDDGMETNASENDVQAIASGSTTEQITKSQKIVDENVNLGNNTEKPSPQQAVKTPEVSKARTPEVITPKNCKKIKAKLNKKLIQDMTVNEINEINDSYHQKYPSKSFGITLQSDNLKDQKWDNYDELVGEIVNQTGIDKYSISEACVVRDTVKATCHLVLKVDDYEDYKTIRDIQNWPQKSFGGTILSVKQLPFVFRQNNFDNYLELIVNVKHGTVLTPNKIKQCEEQFHLTGMERIMTNDGDKQIPTNRYRTKANHVFAYVSACNHGIILASVKYIPETVTNIASLCQKCGLTNCRSSKKKPCQSKPRCMK